MGTYGLAGVIHAWEREEITLEQVIGQILLLLQEMEERICAMERRLEQRREQSLRLTQ